MSSVSGIGGNAQSIYQFIQSLTGNPSTASTSATTGTSSTGTNSLAQTIAQTAQGLGQALQSAGGHHHHHGALKQIQDAVTNALQSAQASGSNSNPNTIVENAIAQVLDGNSTTGAASTSGSNESTSPTINTQNFYQTLQSYGVSPQQFQQDLLSAVKDAQTGNVSNATAFQSFALGGMLNTIG